MKYLFVPYEIALALKEKGFDEPCFEYYTPMKSWMTGGTKSNPKLHFYRCNWANAENRFYFKYTTNPLGDRTATVTNTSFTKAVNNVATPLYQQAIDWLREKHNIDISICIRGDNSYQAYIFKNRQNAIRDDQDIIIDAYYTCLEKAIEEALKLIWPWPST